MAEVSGNETPVVEATQQPELTSTEEKVGKHEDLDIFELHTDAHEGGEDDSAAVEEDSAGEPAPADAEPPAPVTEEAPSTTASQANGNGTAVGKPTATTKPSAKLAVSTAKSTGPSKNGPQTPTVKKVSPKFCYGLYTG